MLEKQALQDLKSAAVKFNVDVPLAGHTSFGTGGPAAIMVEAADRHSVNAVLNIAARHGIPWRVLGNGTNLLVADSGYGGMVIILAGEFKDCRREGGTLVCGAGASLAAAASQAAKNGLAGMEALSQIPGTIGGAVAMNAGAFGSQIGDLVKAVEICDGNGIRLRPAREINFHYRGADLPPNALVTGVALALTPGPEAEIRNRMRSFSSRRRGSQPVGVRTFGSVFKNPPGQDSAGSLLERAGCKNMRAGAAAVSSVHANFIVNEQGATTTDAMALMNRCRQRVHEKFGVVLEPEVSFLGNTGLEEI